MSKYFQDNIQPNDFDLDYDYEDYEYWDAPYTCDNCDGDGVTKGNICNICLGKGKIKNGLK